MIVKWKVRELLDQHNLTPYALWKASGLSRTATYQICSDEMLGLRFDALARLIKGLEKLLGKAITPNDVLEVIRDAP